VARQQLSQFRTYVLTVEQPFAYAAPTYLRTDVLEMTLLTIAFDLALIGSALWLGAAVTLDALHDRRPRIGSTHPRRRASGGRIATVRNERAASVAVARS